MAEVKKEAPKEVDLRTRLLQPAEVLAAKRHRQPFALLPPPFQDGDIFERRLRAPEAARARH